ncbi:cytochrome P450 [Actinocrispum wychmicini]|uniref:Cytochrome P450 n=1 Tax=Actinocrispum wychmicini TaxID=1213861 RepID=A0A4R2JJ26_9PSEU|nr:cytochrome P450 [Actinocrispum wychmicini]TCO59911.1 cytochrome P450 [Actinocrispum wychmicini]
MAGPPEIMVDGGRSLLAWLAGMRADSPVWEDENGHFHVFRFDDVHQVIADPVAFSSDTLRLAGQDETPPGTLLLLDPPLHGKLRKLVSLVFTHKMITELEPRIGEVTAELLDRIDTDDFDLVDTLAYPLPVIVIAELLGVPPADQELFRDWADVLMSSRPDDEASMKLVCEAVHGVDTYLRDQARARRSNPTDDLIGRLVAAEVDGDRLTEEEIVNFSALLLMAGHVTTTMLLGNTMLCLDANPDAAAQLRADPRLIPKVIEEVLRVRPPFVKVERATTRDVEVGGTVIPADRAVSLWLLSANYDERRFPEPDRFDIHRKPNKHTAFGHGIHFCLGAPLARMEGEIALTALFERFSELSVDPSAPAPYYESGIFGVKQLRVIAKAR